MHVACPFSKILFPLLCMSVRTAFRNPHIYMSGHNVFDESIGGTFLILSARESAKRKMKIKKNYGLIEFHRKINNAVSYLVSFKHRKLSINCSRAKYPPIIELDSPFLSNASHQGSNHCWPGAWITESYFLHKFKRSNL